MVLRADGNEGAGYVAIPFSPFSPISPMGKTMVSANTPSSDLVAVCLSCGNEWVVRTPNNPDGKRKKRKCPVCGKYRIRMKSELEAKGDDNAGAGTTSVAVTPPKPPKPVPVPVDAAVDLLIEDEADEVDERGGGSMIVVAGAVVLLVGAAWFGWTLLRRRRRVETVSERERNAGLAVKRYQRLPAVPGF